MVYPADPDSVGFVIWNSEPATISFVLPQLTSSAPTIELLNPTGRNILLGLGTLSTGLMARGICLWRMFSSVPRAAGTTTYVYSTMNCGKLLGFTKENSPEKVVSVLTRVPSMLSRQRGSP